MDSITKGTGTQPAFLKLDWSTLKRRTARILVSKMMTTMVTEATAEITAVTMERTAPETVLSAEIMAA